MSSSFSATPAFLEPLPEVVTGEAQVMMALQAYSLRAHSTDVHGRSGLTDFPRMSCDCRNARDWCTGLSVADVPVQELLNRVEPL